jgi:hypothetical protein
VRVDVFGQLNLVGLEGLFFEHVPGGVGGFLMFALAVGLAVVLLAWHRITAANASRDEARLDDES